MGKKWIKDHNMKIEMLNLLEDKIGALVEDIDRGKDFEYPVCMRNTIQNQ